MQTTLKKTVRLSGGEEGLINVFHLLGDKTRFKIFKLMLTDRELCVSEVAGIIGVSVAAVSQHFRIFELVGLVNKHRYGQMICYTLKEDDPLVKNLVKLSQNK